jgi:hypothetical protein
VHDAPGSVDRAYVDRMLNLMAGMRAGAKLLLFAFERAHDERGRVQWERTGFYVPDAYARDTARAHPQAFEWVASIHPYRADCVAALERAKADGARAVKWLPAAMGMDPASPLCDRFYAAAARLGLPLISHAGRELAVVGADAQDHGNPLKLRRALDAGVRVVVAHCASLGEDRDLDQGPGGPTVDSFALFGRLMAGSWLLLLAALSVFLVGALGLGLLISSIAETQQVAFQLALLASFLPTLMLSGFIFPIASMPAPLQGITYIVPARYFLVALRGIVLKGVGLSVVWVDILALAVYATVVLGLASIRLRRQWT